MNKPQEKNTPGFALPVAPRITDKLLGSDKVLRESDFHNTQPVQSSAPISRFAQRLCK